MILTLVIFALLFFASLLMVFANLKENINRAWIWCIVMVISLLACVHLVQKVEQMFGC